MRRKTKRRFRRGVRRVVLLPALGLLAGAVSRLSVRGADRLGAAAGRLAFAFGGGLAERVLGQLGAALGHRHPPDRLRRIALGSFLHLGGCLAEWLVHVRRGPRRAVDAVVSVSGWRHVEEALARGRGIVVVTAHFGLFELMPVYFIQRGATGKVVGRQPGDEALEGLVVSMRSAMEVPTVFQRQTRELIRLLRDNQLVGTLPDQDVDKLAGVFLPFFGRPAYTPTGPATLAVTTGAALLPVFIHRLGPGRHALVIHPPIEDPGGDREERVLGMTRGWTRVFEAVIAAWPEQWAWLHRRWDTTPELLARRRARRARRDRRLARERGDTGSGIR